MNPPAHAKMGRLVCLFGGGGFLQVICGGKGGLTSSNNQLKDHIRLFMDRVGYSFHPTLNTEEYWGLASVWLGLCDLDLRNIWPWKNLHVSLCTEACWYCLTILVFLCRKVYFFHAYKQWTKVNLNGCITSNCQISVQIQVNHSLNMPFMICQNEDYLLSSQFNSDAQFGHPFDITFVINHC